MGFCPRPREVVLITDTRVGISRDAHLPWRFLERDSLYVSVKPRRERTPQHRVRKRRN
jgi:3-methyladenine DNA glycosylase Mpg